MNVYCSRDQYRYCPETNSTTQTKQTNIFDLKLKSLPWFCILRKINVCKHTMKNRSALEAIKQCTINVSSL